MTSTKQGGFLAEYGTHYSAQEAQKQNIIVFDQHPQFAQLLDIVSRKYCHHVLLQTEFSPTLFPFFCEAFLLHLTKETTPSHLFFAELLYLHPLPRLLTPTAREEIENEFSALKRQLDLREKCFFIAMPTLNWSQQESGSDLQACVNFHLQTLLNHPKCRFIFFDNCASMPVLNEEFASIKLPNLTEANRLAYLQRICLELEAYHQINIPAELLQHAYRLVSRYKGTRDLQIETKLLLDSSAARTAAMSHHDRSSLFIPTLSAQTIDEVISSATHIPSTHLHLSHLKINDLTQGLEQRIFGQEHAITLIAHEIQCAQACVQESRGPLCRFLFVGPSQTGKRTASLALTQQLFQQTEVFFLSKLDHDNNASILDVKLMRYQDNCFFPLKEIISDLPYAVILLENIEEASKGICENLQEIFTTGFCKSPSGKRYDFRQSIIILSTTLGSEQLSELTHQDSFSDDHTMDLMQLVIREQRNQPIHSQHYSPQELAAELERAISHKLPLQHEAKLPIIPFVPLTKMAIEKIVHFKFKLLSRQLENSHAIEFAYAPEVIRYLIHDVMKQQQLHKSMSIEKAFKPVYVCIEHALLRYADNKQRPNQLFLQLNETGEMLKCDWRSLSAVRQHAL